MSRSDVQPDAGAAHEDAMLDTATTAGPSHDTAPAGAGDATSHTEAGAVKEPPAEVRKPRAPRRRKIVEPAPDAEDLFEAAQTPADAVQDPEPAPQSASRPRGRPRRKSTETTDAGLHSSAGARRSGSVGQDTTAGPETTTDPWPVAQALAETEPVEVAAAAAHEHDTAPAAAEPAGDAPDLVEAVADAQEPHAGFAPPAERDAAVPEFEAATQPPSGPRVIGAAEASLATINPNPIRVTDRPDNYLYHLTSPDEAKALMQGGLPCSVDDPIILTERGGIPYWMAVLSEDVDDILDGPVAVVVLRVKRRAVQNYLEPDADSTRAAQAPCFLLTGISGIAPPPVPAAQTRPKPTEPAASGERSPGVEMAGTVKWYNPRKGFGFITPGSGGKDVFVHASTLERSGLSQLNDGQGVRMHVVQGAKGPEAATLSLG